MASLKFGDGVPSKDCVSLGPLVGLAEASYLQNEGCLTDSYEVI